MASLSAIAPSATGTHPDTDPAAHVRREARADIAGFLALGVAVVELVTTEDLAACEACRRVVGHLYATAAVPLPPIDDCCFNCGCRIAPLFLE